MTSRNSLKTPKGTRDWVGGELLLRNHIFTTISSVFECYGGVPLDTPVFELRDILSEKYGEDSKLIYDLADQGGEACSLRYDLTVPFARWLSMNSNVQQIKRYQIAKVYRRDQPAIARGRLREFYQCDFDIAGVYDPMIPDAEILCIIAEIFKALKIGIIVKLNHRKILDGIFAVAGVPTDKIRTTSAAVDKLDKVPWDEVRKELLGKGLSEEVADGVGVYVQQKGSLSEMLERLDSNADLTANERLMEGIADMKLLASYLEAMGAIVQISFDLSLARGLDYYTGLIYEVIVVDNASGVGSIAAGGRYDELVGMYGRQPLPCIGISFGVDRIFTILDARREKKKKGTLDLGDLAQVYIMALGGKDSDGLLLERMSVAHELRRAGIRAEYTGKVKPKQTQQVNASKGVPVWVMLGQEEVEAGKVRLKCLAMGDKTATEEEGAEAMPEKDKGRLVPREQLVEEVRKLLASATLK